MSRENQRLADHVFSSNAIFGERAIRFEYEFDRLGQILSGFLQGSRLDICTRQLLDEPDIPFGSLLKHGGQLHRTTRSLDDMP